MRATRPLRREAEVTTSSTGHVGAHAKSLWPERGLARVALMMFQPSPIVAQMKTKLKHAVGVALAEQEREREAGQNDECDRDEVEEHPGLPDATSAGGLGGHFGAPKCVIH